MCYVISNFKRKILHKTVSFYFLFQKTACNTTTTIELLISISNLSTVMNSSINFVVYVWRGSEFRKAFKEIMCVTTKYSCHKEIWATKCASFLSKK